MKGFVIFEEGKMGGTISNENDFSPAEYSTDSKNGLVATFINFTAKVIGKKMF